MLKYIFFVFLGLLFVGFAWTHTYIYDAYKMQSEVDESWGRVNVFLRPERRVEVEHNKFYYSSPYKLSVFLYANNQDLQLATLMSIKIIDENNNIVFRDDQHREAAFRVSRNNYLTTFIFDNISLNYVEYRVDVRYSIDGVEYRASIFMDKHPNKRKSNLFQSL